MKKVLFILLLIPFQLFSQTKTFEGKVIDATTQEPLPYANISLKGKPVGISSNLDGEFVLKVHDLEPSDKLIVSYIGYKPKEIELHNFLEAYKIIKLEASDLVIDEITITYQRKNPVSILYDAVNNIPFNYKSTPSLLTGFYSEYVKQNGVYINYTEAIIDIFKTGYQSENKDQSKILKGRKKENVFKAAKIDFNLEGGPHYLLLNDIIKKPLNFLVPADFEFYDYKLIAYTDYSGEQAYVIEFEPKELPANFSHSASYNIINRKKYDFKSILYEGVIYVGVESNALLGADFQIAPNRITYADNFFVTKKPKEIKITPIKAAYNLSYKSHEDTYMLDASRADILLRVTDKDNNLVFTYNLFSDLKITNRNDKNPKRFDKDEVIGEREVFSKLIGKYDDAFWKDYNYKRPNQNLVKSLLEQDEVFALKTRLISKLDKYYEKKSGEEVFTHIDRERFKPNDTLWFKSYILDEHFLEPSPKSATVFAGITDYDGKIIDFRRFKADNGFAHGQLPLPENLHSGRYLFFSYSSYEKNKTASDVFIQSIEVTEFPFTNIFIKLSPISPLILEKKNTKLTINSQYFTTLKDTSSNYDLIGKQSLANTKVDYKLFQQKKQIAEGTKTTNYNGIAKIDLKAPEVTDSSKKKNYTLQLKAEHENKIKEQYIPVRTEENKIHIEFFPEGGYLVENINCNLAFKATSEVGQPFTFKGKIIDSKGKVLKSVESSYRGMGVVRIKIPDNKNYYLVIEDSTFKNQQFELPKPLKKGISMEVTKPFPGEWQLKLHGNTNKTESLLCFLQIRGKVYLAREINLEKENSISIYPKHYPRGTALITIMNSRGVPLAERLIFIDNYEKIKFRISADKKTYANREKVNLKISTSDGFGRPAPTNFSISVFSKEFGRSDEFSNHNIVSHYLFNNELKGNVPYDPYLFEGTEYSEKALDLIMMTHGWRRYSWPEILNTNIPDIKEQKSYDQITGKAYKRRRPAKNVDVLAMQYPNTSMAGMIETNESGKFAFNLHQIDANNQFLSFMVSSDRKRNPYTIKLDTIINDNFLANFSDYINDKYPFPIPHFNSRARYKEKINLELDNSYLIEEVVIKGKRPFKPKNKYDDYFGAYSPVKEVPENIYKDVVNLEDMLIRICNPFYINRSRGILHMNTSYNRDRRIWGFYTFPVYFVVNDIRIGNSYTIIKHLKSEHIKKITLLNGYEGFMEYGKKAMGGVVFIETHDLIDLAEEKESPDYLTILHLYENQKEYYKPKYDKEWKKHMGNIDFRTSLYWAPNIDTDNSGVAHISFYTSDVSGDFEVVINGIGNNGKLGSFSKTIQVNK